MSIGTMPQCSGELCLAVLPRRLHTSPSPPRRLKQPYYPMLVVLIYNDEIKVYKVWWESNIDNIISDDWSMCEMGDTAVYPQGGI